MNINASFSESHMIHALKQSQQHLNAWPLRQDYTDQENNSIIIKSGKVVAFKKTRIISKQSKFPISNNHSISGYASTHFQTNKLFFLLFCIFFKISIVQSSIAVLNQQAKSSTSLVYSLFDTNTFVAANSLMIITLPKQYSALSLYQNQPYTGYDVNTDFCPLDFACTGVTISYQGYNLVISGLFPNSITGIIMTYTIYNIINPSYQCVTDNIQIKIVSSNLLTSYYTQSSTGFTITAPPLSYSVSLTSKYLWSQSPMLLTLTSSNSISSFLIQFPSKWQNESRISNSIIPSIVVQSTTHKISYLNVGQNVQILNFVFNPGGSSQSISISINSIYTPSQIIDIGPIIVSAYNEQGFIIQESTFFISKTNLYSQSLRQTSSSIVYDLINYKITTNLFFTMPQDSISSDQILISYPTALPVASTSSSYTIIVNSATIASIPNIDIANNSISVTPFTFTYFQANVQVSMVTNWPRTSIQTSDFVIQSIRLGAYLMQTAVCCSLQILQKNSLLVSLSVTNQQRSKTNVVYTFQLTHQVTTLTTTDSLVIQFPEQYTLIINSTFQTSICSSLVFTIPSNSSNINHSFTCLVQTNLLKISNFLLSNNFATLIGIQITINNPTVNSSSPFSIWSEDSSGLKIESNYNTTITINSAVFTSMQITPSNYVTNSVANYEFLIGNVGTISKNSAILIVLPSDYNPPYYPLNCYVNTINTLCSIDQTTRKIKIIVASDIITSPTNITINLLNPRSQQPTNTFLIQIYDISNNMIETSNGLSSGINLTMLSSNNFVVASFSSDASYIASQGNLNFVFTLPFYPKITQTFTLKIQLSPLNMFILNSSSCFVNSLAYACPPQNSSFLEITLSSLVLSSNLLQITLTKVTIISDSSISASATLYLQINSTLYSSITTQSNMTLSSSNAVILSNYSITQTSYYMKQATTITLSIFSIPLGLKFDQALISIPSNYKSSSYIFTNSNNLTSILINPSGLLNPTEVNQECFTFHLSYLGEVVAISSSSSQYFDVQCDLPCRSCKGIAGINRTLCESCYQIAEFNMGYFRLISSVSPYGECTDHCLIGEYINATTFSCQPCNSSCKSCQMGSNSTSGNANKCLKCNSNLFLLNNICYITCPTGYYMNSQICSPCIDNCEICNSLQVCLECISNHSLYSNQCFLICPPTTVRTQISNSTAYQCLSCSTNCLECLTSSTCLVCQTNFYLYNSICVSSCPSADNFYPNLNNQCVTCDCLQCSSFSYNCTKCSNLLIFDQNYNRCYLKCQDGKYNNSGICTSCFTNCSVCLTANLCSICQQSFILYTLNSTHSQCLQTCPNSTILTIQVVNPATYVLSCLKCLNNCLTCILSQTFCLSCSSSYVFLNNSCLNSCPAPFWNISNFCQICATQCQICLSTNPYNCSQCVQGYYLSNNTCIDTCPVKTYSSISLKKCLSCQLLCETCLNSTSCTSCIAGYYLFTNNLCYNSCPTVPTYYYTYKGQCILCQPQCTSCLSTPIQCTSCSSSIYYFNVQTKQCNTTCLNPYFINGNQCIKCQAPCSQCDTNFNSCSSCFSNSSLPYLYKGTCVNSCPTGYYSKSITSTNKTCHICPFPCSSCTQTQCLTCESFSFMYKTTCVLDCSIYSDMPFSKDSYCTNCLSVPFCTVCQLSQAATMQCFSCTYPYVIFDGTCLNGCPQNYQINNSVDRKCIQSPSYLLELQQEYERNKPKLPFQFLVIGVILIIIIYPVTNIIYQYSYNVGYMLFIMNLFDYFLTYWWLLLQSSNYKGQYVDGAEQIIPNILLGVYLLLNLVILGWVGFGIWGLKYCYLRDQRYKQWKCQNQTNFMTFLIIFVLFGPKTHKLYYSKLFGLERFAYRIISVQKFQTQDRINFISSFVDLFSIMAFVIVTYNVFIQYSVLYLVGIEVLIIKIIIWILLIIDSKKPDRGFFMGDQKQALEQIKIEEEQKNALLRRVNTDNLIRMIRKKSAILFDYNPCPFGELDKIQFLSVYNPDDYQDVIKVPNKRIQKNIQKGKFRRGRKITIQERLQRFADSIKPKPTMIKDQSFLKGLIYWKPPKKLKVQTQTDTKMSQQQMLRILENKQLEYRNQLDQISQIVFEEKSQISPKFDKDNFKTGQYFFGGDHFGSYNQLQESIQHQGEASIQDLSSHIIKFDDVQYNDLMNLNYAKKKHLPKKEKKPKFDDNQMRILYHQPMKKRRGKPQ